jgi:hypothetical protein
MGNFLRLASRKTTTLDLGEGGELVVKTDISKGDFEALLARLPVDMGGDDGTGFTPLEADNFTTGVFAMLVKGWNATDEDGNPVDPTVENYLQLPREATAILDAKLLEYFNSLSVTNEEKTKSKKAG